MIDLYEPKKDCFGYQKGGNGDEDCVALCGLFCKFEPQCRFYKKREQVEQQKGRDDDG